MTEFNEKFNKNCLRNCDRDQRKTTTDEDINQEIGYAY
jgi:hypothetical protein